MLSEKCITTSKNSNYSCCHCSELLATSTDKALLESASRLLQLWLSGGGATGAAVERALRDALSARLSALPSLVAAATADSQESKSQKVSISKQKQKSKRASEVVIYEEMLIFIHKRF